jgi:predicted phage-related endonuclease
VTVAAKVPVRAPFRVLDFGNRAAWLEARQTLGVGSSEVACLFSRPGQPLSGLSNWSSPLSLSYLKRGLSAAREDDDETLDWGLYAEPSIARWFADKVLPEVDFRLSAIDPGRYAVLQPLDGFPWFSSVDRLLVQEGGAPEDAEAVLEIKNASAWMAGEWAEGEPPLIYVLQVQQQLAVTGLPVGYLCVSIGGAPPKWAEVKRDESVIAILRERVAEFWRSVLANEDPPIDGHDETARAIFSRWPQDDGQSVELGDIHAKAWDARCQLHERIGDLTERKQRATNFLKHAIGSASLGTLPDGRVLSLRTDRAGRRNLKEGK